MAVACILVLAALLGLKAASTAGAAGLNFQVNSTADALDAVVGDGLCRTTAGTCTLRAAIQEANAIPGTDVILVPAGTYALAIPPLNQNDITTGDLDITDSLEIRGAGAGSTFIDGGTPPAGAPPDVRGLDRLFEVLVDDGDVSFSGLTVSDGTAAEYGGAIMNNSTAAVIVTAAVLRGNVAGETGGAIDNHVGGAVAVSDSTLSGNYAGESGSAINNNRDGTLTVTNSSISGNSAAVVGLDETLRGAGAIANNAELDARGTISVTDSEISDNRAGGGRNGAGISNDGGGTLAVDGSSFARNGADADGGAIYSGPGEVTVTNSTFSENSADNGAGISSGGSLTVLDSVFTKNAGRDWGGGVHNFNLGGVVIRSSSFSENSALSGGGLANEGSGLVTVESSSFRKNTAVISAILDSGDGGGMHSNSGGQVVVTDVTFIENTARGGGGLSNGGGGQVVVTGSRFSANVADERGGGILVEGGDVRMVDIDVVGNTSKSAGEGGGGISYAGDKSVSVGDSAAIQRSRILDNKSSGEGGGIDSRGDGPLGIVETTITGNTGIIGGGLHHVGDAPLLVSRSTLARNVSEHGGGVFVDGDGEATVENSTLSGNRAGQFGGGLLAFSRVNVRSSTVAANNAPSGGGINNGGGALIGDGFVFLANSIVANNPTGGNCAGTITSRGGNLENVNTCQLGQPGDQPGKIPLLGALADNGGRTHTHALLSGSPAQDAAVCTALDPCPAVDQRGVARPLFQGHDVGAYESELLPGGDPAPPPPGECPKLPNSLTAEADSWVSQGSPSNNSGTDSSLKVKSQSGSNSRVLVRFPLPPLPEGCTTIASAVLRLTSASAKEDRTLAVLQAAGAWTESGVTWNNQPPTTGPAATAPSATGVLEWDVTAHTLGIYAAGNHGFLIRDAAENGVGDEQSLKSREKGNDGPPQFVVVFDDSTPETAIDARPASPTNATTATFAFSSDHGDAAFECSLDGAQFGACGVGHTVSGLAEGRHRLEVRAMRPVRAVDPTPAGYEWTVDLTAPEAAIDSGPADPTNEISAQLGFAASDNVDELAQLAFQCRLDESSSWEDCEIPANYERLAAGRHVFEVRAIDRAGNVGPVASRTWTIDLTAPETGIDSGPADPSNSPTAAFAFSADEEATFDCSLDGAPFAPCPEGYSELAEGAHVLEVRAVDRAGNGDPTPAVYRWTIDLTAPRTAVGARPFDPTNSSSASFAFSADEPASFECRLDGGAFAACASPQSYDGLAEGAHTFDVRAIDRAGNVDPMPAREVWTVDLTPPEASIDEQPRDPTSSESARFVFSANEDASFECRLDAGAFAACTSAASYEGLAEGPHSFEVRATDRAGNLEPIAARAEWTVDVTPPETAIDSGPADPSASPSADFSFSADEDATFECSLDAGPFAPCSPAHTYGGLGEGGHLVEVRAVDRAGNVDPEPAVHGWRIDLTAPKTSIGAHPDDPTNSTAATFGFSADEDASFECRLDGAPYAPCGSPQSYDGLAEGGHAFDVRAIDRAGNVDATPARAIWTVDLTPPETTIDAQPADPTSATSADFAFSADELSTFECRLDGASFAACSSPAEYRNLAEGAHRFEVRAVDRAGNVEADAVAYTWTIDLTAPQTAIDSGPADPSNSSSAEFEFSADEEATFSCSLDGTPFAACPSRYDGLADGAHTLEVRAADRAGNVDGTPAVHNWTIDLTQPDTRIDSGPADRTASTSASFVFSADEAASFECSLDGGAYATCTSQQTYESLGEGAHAFDVRAIDRAGNVDSSAARYAWTIDLTAPETEIDSGPGDPSDDSTAAFSFVADEEAAFECSLDRAPFAACVSGQSYEGLAEGRHTFAVRAIDLAGNVDPTPAAHDWTIDQTAPDTTIQSGPRDPTNEPSASFVFASGETGSTFECSLDGAPFASCASPAGYGGLTAGEHTFRVRATDRAANTDPMPAAASWTIDLAPPQTTVASGPRDPSNSSSAEFVFSADEAASFECRLDGGSFTACVSPATYEGLGEGMHAFDVRAVDVAGNADPTPARSSWTIDRTAPQATIGFGPADPTNSTSAEFAFSADEQGSAFECSLDGAAFSPCGSPAAYGGLTPGPHAFRVVAIDRAGNVDPTPASHAWVVDTTAPQTTISERPAEPSNSGTASFAFSADEAARFECRLDGDGYSVCSSPQLYVGLAEGSHTFEVRATDRAGNADPSPAAYSWTIDQTAPQTTIDSGPAATTTSTSATFTFSASEAGSTFECSLDSAAFAACASPRSYDALAVGGHELRVRATDAAANTDASPAVQTWTVEAPDTTAPATTIDFGPPALTSSTSASFSFSSSKPGSTFECSLDGAAFAGCTSPRSYVGLANGAHQFRVRARDSAGNLDLTPATYNWTIDTAAPDTTIVSAPPVLTSSTSASFSFSSNDSGATFDCSLDGAAFAACVSPRQYSGLADGGHQFRVRARDGADNVDASPAPHNWTIDTVAPETSIASAPPATTTSTSAGFSFSAGETGSTFECSLDGSAFAACISPRQYSGLSVGSHQFRVRARDGSGNFDATPATHGWTITAPPAGCPAPATLGALADAWIDENSASSNKGGDSILKIQSKGPRDNFRALVRFPLPVVPAGCRIDTVTLRLFAASMKPDRRLLALRLGGSWVENAVSWANQPPTAGTAATAFSGFGYRDWDVTSHVQAMLDGAANHGFLIRDALESEDAEQQFHSREKGESPPQLVVQFVSDG